MITTFIFDTDILNDAEVCTKALNTVSAVRREKAEGMRLKKDKNLSLGAGLLLSYGLRLFGVSGEPVITEHGKPVIDGIFFSVSHSGHYAVCAFSNKDAGADIEEIRNVRPELVKKVATPAEFEHITSIADCTDRKNEFFRMWTAKEAAMKLLGRGLSASMKNFETDFSKPLSVSSPLFKERVNFKEYDVRGYALTVCGYDSDFAENVTEIKMADLK